MITFLWTNSECNRKWEWRNSLFLISIIAQSNQIKNINFMRKILSWKMKFSSCLSLFSAPRWNVKKYIFLPHFYTPLGTPSSTLLKIVVTFLSPPHSHSFVYLSSVTEREFLWSMWSPWEHLIMNCFRGFFHHLHFYLFWYSASGIYVMECTLYICDEKCEENREWQQEKEEITFTTIFCLL